jgi:hypothetical protein
MEFVASRVKATSVASVVMQEKATVEEPAAQENAFPFQFLEDRILSISALTQLLVANQLEDQETFVVPAQHAHQKQAWNGLVLMDVVCTLTSFHETLYAVWVWAAEEDN